jgi:hypothetical protein
MSSPEKLLYVCRRGDLFFWGWGPNQLSPPFVKMLHFHIKTRKELNVFSLKFLFILGGWVIERNSFL